MDVWIKDYSIYRKGKTRSVVMVRKNITEFQYSEYKHFTLIMFQFSSFNKYFNIKISV
jgi:hypothetical protein